MLKREDYIGQMTPKKGGFKPIYRLRWSFHWLNGRVKNGIWNGSSNNFSDTAAALNKTGLANAFIETEDFQGYGIEKAYSCDGDQYVTAKWIAASAMGSPFSKIKWQSITLTPDIIGLQFLTTKDCVSVFVDGSISRRSHRPDEDIENIREHRI